MSSPDGGPVRFSPRPFSTSSYSSDFSSSSSYAVPPSNWRILVEQLDKLRDKHLSLYREILLKNHAAESEILEHLKVVGQQPEQRHPSPLKKPEILSPLQDFHQTKVREVLLSPDLQGDSKYDAERLTIIIELTSGLSAKIAESATLFEETKALRSSGLEARVKRTGDAGERLLHIQFEKAIKEGFDACQEIINEIVSIGGRNYGAS